MPKISAVIPIYNAEKFLNRCLDSVINQTLKDLEIICINDGSTDSSELIAKEYAKSDNRFVIINIKNSGAGIARNTGLNAATGEYIHFLDADDMITPDTYEKAYKILSETKADVIKFGGYSLDNETGEINEISYLSLPNVDKKNFDKTLFLKNDIETLIQLPDSPWSGIYDTDFIKKHDIKFNTDRYLNDTVFLYACILNANKVYLSSEKFVYYRQNISSSLMSKRISHFDCYEHLYKDCCELCRNTEEKYRNILINKVITITFNSYYKMIRSKETGLEKKLKINHYMKRFLNAVKNEKLNDKNREKYDKLTFELGNDLFSVRKSTEEILLKILFVKFRFKRKNK